MDEIKCMKPMYSMSQTRQNPRGIFCWIKKNNPLLQNVNSCMPFPQESEGLDEVGGEARGRGGDGRVRG